MQEKLLLVKPTSDGRETTVRAEAIQEIDLPIGGAEGRKALLTVAFPNGKDSWAATYFVKDGTNNRRLLPQKVKELCLIYNALMRKGYPVPEVARYIDTGNGLSLLLSDMTVGGLYLIWGLSENTTKEYRDSLLDLKISEQDLEKIEILVESLASRASQDGVWLPYYSYQVRKHKETGIIDIILLDLETVTFMHSAGNPDLEKNNMQSARYFVNSFRDEVEMMNRISQKRKRES